MCVDSYQWRKYFLILVVTTLFDTKSAREGRGKGIREASYQ